MSKRNDYSINIDDKEFHSKKYRTVSSWYDSYEKLNLTLAQLKNQKLMTEIQLRKNDEGQEIIKCKLRALDSLIRQKNENKKD